MKILYNPLNPSEAEVDIRLEKVIGIIFYSFMLVIFVMPFFIFRKDTKHNDSKHSQDSVIQTRKAFVNHKIYGETEISLIDVEDTYSGSKLFLRGNNLAIDIGLERRN